MKRAQRLVLLSRLARELLDKGSWCGETHIQKAVYLLQGLTKVNPGFDFTLYRHGPFSFDLRYELNEMISSGLIDVEQHPPYGPSLIPSMAAKELESRFPKSFVATRQALRFVADAVGDADVFTLERLATALYLLRLNAGSDDARLAEMLRDLKPHVSKPDAESAVRRVTELDLASRDLGASFV